MSIDNYTIGSIFADESERAARLHPDWPDDHAKGFAILAEEVGEVATALNDGDLRHALRELEQAGAMCIRLYQAIHADVFDEAEETVKDPPPDLEDDVDPDAGEVVSDPEEHDETPDEPQESVNPGPIPSDRIRVHNPRPTDCRVFIEQVTPNSRRCRVHVKARAGETMPALAVHGFQTPHYGTKVLDGWNGVQWKDPQTSRGGLSHTGRNYPHQWYSAIASFYSVPFNCVMGISVLHDIRTWPAEIHFNYRREEEHDSWMITAEFRRTEREVFTFTEDTSFSFDIVIGGAHIDRWQDTFLTYRDHHRALHSTPPVAFNPEPIAAVSFGVRQAASPDNPRGFTSPPWNNGRFDYTGYAGFHDWCRDVLIAQHGFRRLMIWNPTGVYPTSGFAMRWDISTGRTPAMIATWNEVIRATRELGVEVGFWWGHSMWIGDDPDGQDRRPLTSDAFVEAHREIVPLIRGGARIIGHDAMPRRIVATDKNPDLFTAYHFLNCLRTWSKGTQWILEASASDFNHRFGGSFVWAHLLNSSDAQDWANWLHGERRPILAVMKHDRHPVTQERFDELLSQGYTPLVFSPHRRGIINSKGLTK